MSTLNLVAAKSPDQIAQAHNLFVEYAAGLNISLCFQNFNRELATLPGNYAPPSGRLLLAEYDSEVAGCVGLQKLEEEICEMKRLYVRPAFRRKNVGRTLATAILAEARQIGYRSMRLDTLQIMKEALALYQSLGFRPIEAYYQNPIEGVIYLELELI